MSEVPASPSSPSTQSPSTQAEIGLIAQQGVTTFLEMIGRGLPVRICENTQCRVALYTAPPDIAAGRKIVLCPGCYGSPST